MARFGVCVCARWRGVLGLRQEADLVARGCGRCADGRGMELRDVGTIRLAQAIRIRDERVGAGDEDADADGEIVRS